MPLSMTMVPTDELVAYAGNARTHGPAQIARIAASIAEFGFLNPVITDGEHGIIAGHARVLAARSLGLAEVPTLAASHLSAAQRRAYVLADNRLALDAGWDASILTAELQALDLESFDLGLTGFGAGELERLLMPDAVPGEDDIGALPDTAVSRSGDLWLLGSHRLLCGDSTIAEAVEHLLGDAVPHLMVTDPPYGVNYDASWRKRAGLSAGGAIGKVANDDRADWGQAWELFPGDVAYVWHGGLHAGEVADSLEKVGFAIRAQIIWAKSALAISRGDYHWQHEPCWYAVRSRATGHWTGDRTQSTLWQIDKPMKSQTGHATQKPVECMRRPMLNNSGVGQAVYDPFIGSGTTLIAAETLGRWCLGIEIDPAHVDVALQRWQALTGRQATLEGSGQRLDETQGAAPGQSGGQSQDRTFAEVRAERRAAQGAAAQAAGTDAPRPASRSP